MSRRYVVVGCGAVGGLYGARLAVAGVHEQGLQVDSIDRDVHVALGSSCLATSMNDVATPDVVIVAVKTTADVDVSPLLGPNTALAVLQDGLGVEATAGRRSRGTTARRWLRSAITALACRASRRGGAPST